MDLQALNSKDNHTLSRVTRPRSKVSAAPFFWGGFFGQLVAGDLDGFGVDVFSEIPCLFFFWGGDMFRLQSLVFWGV